MGEDDSKPIEDGPNSKDASPADKDGGDESSAVAAAATSAPQASSATKQHQVTEVPKFRFVSIAKKSAGYSSAAAGRYVEGKSAEELAAKYSAPDVVSSSYDAQKNRPVVVGKLNIAEREKAMGKRLEKEGGVGEDDLEREERKEEEEEEDGSTTEEEEAKVATERDEEKDLEAAVPLDDLTETKQINNQVEIAGDSYEGSQRQGVLYSVDSGEVVAKVVPTNQKDNTSKKDAPDRRGKCSTKNKILSALLFVLLAAVAALSAVFATKQSGDASSSLRNDNMVNEDGASGPSNNVTLTEDPSDLASWDAPTQSPKPPTQAQLPSAVQSCIGLQAEDACMENADIKQQLFVPQGGSNPVNIHFGHSLAFINNNIIAAATDGSGPDAGVQIYFKESSGLYRHFQSIYDGDEHHMFGYSLAKSKNTNTLVVGAPARKQDGKIECVQVWCDVCSWSAFESTPCEDRLNVIVSDTNGDKDEIKKQIMASGRCIADEICNEVVNSGKVYIYEPMGNTWERVAIVTSDDASFGSVVAMDGGIIAVGSPDENKVSIYERNGSEWILMETKSSGTNDARFGSSLSLSGGVLVVGAPLDGIGGIAYVYAFTSRGFVLQGPPLEPKDVAPGDNFGDQVSISGCTVAVSSSRDVTTSTTTSGSIRIFNYDRDLGMYITVQLIEPDEEVAGAFPECVVMEGNNLLVGSSRGGSFSSGILTHFIRKNNVWIQKSIISNPLLSGGSAAGVFGCGLSISQSSALVGAKGTEQGRPGSFYVADLCPDEDELI